jgi:hypothetical protein
MKQIAGYHMSLADAHTIAKRLNIDIGEPTLFNLQRMEWPINDWLFNHNMLHMKAAQLQWPQDKDGEGGMFFLTKSQPNYEVIGTIAEEDSDLEVKKWLEKHGAEKVEWLCWWDRYSITLGGDQPKYTGVKHHQCATMEEFMEKAGLPYNLKA